jgi:hypothetical protein
MPPLPTWLGHWPGISFLRRDLVTVPETREFGDRPGNSLDVFDAAVGVTGIATLGARKNRIV